MGVTLLFIVVTVGLIILISGKLLLQPGKLAARLALNSVLGLLLLWLVNFAGGYVGFRIPINIITVVTAGCLGIPGLGILAFLEFLIGI